MNIWANKIWANEAESASKGCEASYVLDTAGTISTGWKDLGQVGGTFVNKKKECKELAIKNCAHAKEKLDVYAPVGSANFNAICQAGILNVYFDTRVEGKKNSKDGTCSTPVSCESRTTCTCPQGYWQEKEWCVMKACQPVNPKPANNTSFLQTGYFFWEGELRYRTKGNCTTEWLSYACSNKQWTGWLNRDTRGGTGDFETLKDFLAAGQGCPKPLDIQCQTLDGRDWKETGQTYTCDPNVGGICRNDQNNNSCLDYHIRLLCCKS